MPEPICWGIYSRLIFLFLLIFLLIVKVFGMTLQMSQMESRQKELVQRIALDQKDREELELKIQRFPWNRRSQPERTAR